MTTSNVEALKALYAALGGTPSDVANASTIVDVLNAIAALYEGDSDATLNAEAISNIAAIAGSIAPEPTLIEKTITANDTYNASDDNADGYSKVTVNVVNENNAKFESLDSFAVYQNLQELEIPAGATTLINFACRNCGRMQKVTLPQGLITISTEAFKGCGFLKNIEFPNSVTSIGTYALSGCTSLEYIKFTSNTPPTIASQNSYENVPTTCKILVPTGTIETYKATPNYPDPATYTYEEF